MVANLSIPRRNAVIDPGRSVSLLRLRPIGLFARIVLTLFCLLAMASASLRAEGNLKLSILTNAIHPIEGEMIEVTIRGVYDRKVAVQKLELDPVDGFDWVQIAQDRWGEERIDGLPYIVFERKLAVWPRRTGTLMFGPARHVMTVIDKQSQRRDVVVTAKPAAISVGAFPDLKGWHFTARQVTLTDELSTDAARLQDGESVLRKVTLRALGALPEHLTPRPVVSENWLITFAAPVQRRLEITPEGPLAEVIWTWQFRPHTGEPGLLEPVRLPFYNTSTRQLDAVQIPPLAIGYASFFTGQLPKGALRPGQIALLGGMAALGLCLGLAAAALRLRPDATRSGWRRLAARYALRRRLALLRARRRGDLFTERRLSEELFLPPERLKALDQRLYGPPSL